MPLYVSLHPQSLRSPEPAYLLALTHNLAGACAIVQADQDLSTYIQPSALYRDEIEVLAHLYL